MHQWMIALLGLLLTPAVLAQMLQNMERPALLERALKAKTMEKTQATALIVAACEELAR